MPRGMGGDQRAVQGATTGGGQALRHGPFQDLTMKGLQQWSDPVAEGIPAAARGRDPQSQPLKAATIARVFRPLVRRMMAGLDHVQGDLEHQIGPMGLGAHAEIGGEQESQIELIDRLVDGAGAMVGGQGVLDREPLGGPRIPGRHGEAIEFGTVLGWRRVDRYREVERAARPVERAMVLRSRWEYHSSRAPFEGAGYPFAILRRGSPYSLYPLEPAESGTISITGGEIGVSSRGNRCQFVLPSGNCMNCSENPARNWPGGATIPPGPHEAPGVHCLRGGVLPWCRTRSMAQTSAHRSTVTRTGRRRRASEDVARETFCSTCSPRVGGNNSGYAATSGPD